MSVRINPSNLPVTPSQVESFERERNIRLPRDYVDFLTRYGAGDPIDNICTLDDRVSVSKFCGLGHSANSVRNLISTYEDRLPRNCIPVAEAAGGNLVLLMLIDQSICFWDHELEDIDNDRPDRNAACKTIAKSFTEFLESLRPMKSDDMPKAKVLSVKVDPAFAAKFGINIK